jgi:hypothetical protein
MLLSEMRGLPPAFLWRLASHKLGRLSLPFMLAAAFGFSLSLLARRRYRVAALLQASVYGVGALSATGHRPRAVPNWAAQPLAQFTVGNYATAAGVIRGLRRRQSVTWKTVR